MEESETDPPRHPPAHRLDAIAAGDLDPGASAHVESCEWTLDGIDLRAAVDELGVKARKALPVVYAAIEGKTAGLPLFDAIFLLGRDSALLRLRAARQRLGTA